jgi:outer membrane protein
LTDALQSSASRARRDPLAGAAKLSTRFGAGRLAGALAGCLALAAPAAAETMSGALSRASIGNPDLNQERAGTRAQDENIPRATAGWRPTVSATGQFGYNYLDTTQGGVRTHGSTPPTTVALTVTQNVFNGNRTLNSVRQAESNIFGSRENLRNTEQDVLLNGATAYMNVLRDTAILDLRRNNITVLEEQLRQTRDRFNVGEVTRTDVAQAESSLASSRSDYFTAQANLQTSIANFRQIIGIEPTRLEPARTIEALLPKDMNGAVDLALGEHPAIQAAFHAVDAAELQVKLVEGELYPTLNVVGSVRHDTDYIGVRNATFLTARCPGNSACPSMRAAKFTLAPARPRRHWRRRVCRPICSVTRCAPPWSRPGVSSTRRGR